MKRFKTSLQGMLLAATIFTPLLSDAANVTVHVQKNDGTTPLAGVAATYQSTYTYTMGNTDVSGNVTKSIANGTYNFRVTYRGTSTVIPVTISGDTTLEFYTSGITANVSSCGNAGIAGAQAKYASGAYEYWIGGNTDVSGNTSDQVFPGTYNFTAIYHGTSASQMATVAGDGLSAGNSSTVTFHPTAVTLSNAGSKTYKSGPYSYYANGLTYIFPGTYEFTFPGGYKTDLTIAGCTQNLTVNILVLKDHNNNPLSGGTGRYGYGTNYSTAFVPGSTDANGLIFHVVNTSVNPIMSYEMKYNTTTSVLTQDVTTTNGNVFMFKTNEVRLRLQTCSNAGLSGGTARWGNGAIATSYYFPGVNVTDANGEMAAEMFPGTYSFEMNYQSSSNVKSSVAIPNSNTLLTWTTTNVTLNWPYDIAYGGAGDNRYFNKPSMELLPGNLNFNFRAPAALGGYNYTTLTIDGCSMTLTPGLVRLISSTNAPISGASVDGYQGGWSTYGTTGANGNLLVIGKNPSSVAMTLGGGRQQLNSISFATNPVVIFQTKLVTMDFTDASGNHTLQGSGLQYYAGGWNTFGSGSTTNGIETMEMLPASYSFKLGYMGAVQQITSQNVSVNPLVSYQTAVADIYLKDLSNNGIAGGNATFYAGGWHNIGATDANGHIAIELLPVTYSFAMSYAAKYNQKNGIAVPGTVNFTFDGSSLYKIAPEQEATSNEIKAYPNPVNDQLTISLSSTESKTAEVKLVDLTGKTMLNMSVNLEKGQNVQQLNVSQLPNGTYLLMVDNSKENMSRIVVMH